MTTPDVTETTPDVTDDEATAAGATAAVASDDATPTLRLDDGPLGEAMAAVTRAFAGIKEAESVLVERRQQLSAVLGEELRAVLDAEPEDVVAEVRPTLATLYWEHADVLRVQDLTDATGLSGAQLRKVVGPRRLEVPCDGCGTPLELVQTSRSQPLRSLCQLCSWPGYPPPPTEAYSASGAPLGPLADHLDEVIARAGCSGGLARTRAWAAAAGLDPDALVAEVRAHGAHCDCEVILNVPIQE